MHWDPAQSSTSIGAWLDLPRGLGGSCGEAGVGCSSHGVEDTSSRGPRA